MDTDILTIYLAPCFGVSGREAVSKIMGLSRNEMKGIERAGAREIKTWQKDNRKATTKDDLLLMNFGGEGSFVTEVRKRLAACLVPDDLEVFAGSTSREKDAARSFTWADVKRIYGDCGACLVLIEQQKKGFDGKSHQACSAWVRAVLRPQPAESWFQRALGFAIQRDRQGYYVRFSSTLNQKLGQGGAATFVARDDVEKKSSREPRDLPKEWSMQLLSVLSRDLKMAYHDFEAPRPRDRRDRTAANKLFGRMVSRNETETTKFKSLSFEEVEAGELEGLRAYYLT